MALRMVSAKVVPMTLALAKEFRDMKALKGERELERNRCRSHLNLLAQGNFFTSLWGKCRYAPTGEMLRGNGNHTSNLLTACLSSSTESGMDTKSKRFCETYLWGKAHGKSPKVPKELPIVKDGQLKALVEEFTADDENDLQAFFRRYDAKESARNPSHILNIYASRFDDLEGLERRKIARVLNGVSRVLKEYPKKFGFSDKSAVVMPSGGEGPGLLLAYDKVREVVKWIIETVPYRELYDYVAGAQVLIEMLLEEGPEQAQKIVEKLSNDLALKLNPALKWQSSLVNTRNRPSIEHLVKTGRDVIRSVKSRLDEEDPPAEEEDTDEEAA